MSSPFPVCSPTAPHTQFVFSDLCQDQMVSQKQLSSALRFCCCMVKATSGPITHTTKSGLLTQTTSHWISPACLLEPAHGYLASWQVKRRQEIKLAFTSVFKKEARHQGRGAGKLYLDRDGPRELSAFHHLTCTELLTGFTYSIPSIQIPCVSISGDEGGQAWCSLRRRTRFLHVQPTR